MIRGSWSTVNGRRRRSYALTAAGRRTLSDERSSWQEFSAAVTALLGTAHGRQQPSDWTNRDAVADYLAAVAAQLPATIRPGRGHR